MKQADRICPPYQPIQKHLIKNDMKKFKNVLIPFVIILLVTAGFRFITPLKKAVISAHYQENGYSKRIADQKAEEETK